MFKNLSCENAEMSNNSSRVQSAQGERAAGTCQRALYTHNRWLKMDKDRTAHAYLRACTNGIVKRPLDSKLLRWRVDSAEAALSARGKHEKKVINEFHWSFSEVRPTRYASVLVMLSKYCSCAGSVSNATQSQYQVRTVYISHGECGGHHHFVSTKPLSMSARNSDARFLGASVHRPDSASKEIRHARSSAA